MFPAEPTVGQMMDLETIRISTLATAMPITLQNKLTSLLPIVGVEIVSIIHHVRFRDPGPNFIDSLKLSFPFRKRRPYRAKVSGRRESDEPDGQSGQDRRRDEQDHSVHTFPPYSLTIQMAD